MTRDQELALYEKIEEKDARIAELTEENKSLKELARMNVTEKEVLLTEEIDRLRNRKDGAYLERNNCVFLIAKMALALGLKAGRSVHDPNDKDWEDDWGSIIYIDLPSGQVSWHFHDSQKHLLDELPLYDGIWDGHTIETKYERVLNPGELGNENQKLRERIKNLREALSEIAARTEIVPNEEWNRLLKKVAREALTEDAKEEKK